MFKRGGSAGQGITSGLDRPGYYGGGSSTQDRLLKAIGPKQSGIYDFLTEWGLNMASASPTGNVLQTGAAQAKGPYERFVKGKQGEENLLRQVALEGEGIDIKAEQAALAAEAEANLKRELLKTRGEQQKELYEIEKGENLEALVQARAAENIAEGKYNNYAHSKNEAEWTYIGSKKYTDRKNGGVLIIEHALPGKKQTKWLKNQGKKNGVGTIYYDPFGDRVLEIDHTQEDGYFFKPVEGVSEDTVSEGTVTKGDTKKVVDWDIEVEREKFKNVPKFTEEYLRKRFETYVQGIRNKQSTTYQAGMGSQAMTSLNAEDKVFWRNYQNDPERAYQRWKNKITNWAVKQKKQKDV